MIPRSLRLPTLLAASVAVPYAASNAPDWAKQVQLPESLRSQVGMSAPPLLPANATASNPAIPPLRPVPSLAPPSAPGSDIIPVTTPLEGYPIYSISEVFRMDVSKEWVYQRWPRKSTSVGSLNQYGVRVPLVTGPQRHDVAGALTYYFGPDGQVERLSFHGRTADTTQMVMMATQRFGLIRQPSLNPAEQLFQAERDGQIISELRTRPAPVLWESSPYDSFTVDLELQQGDAARPLAELLRQPVTTASAPPAPSPAQSPAGTTMPTSATANSAATEAKPSKSTKEKIESAWNSLFPRSRVPKNQLDDLQMPREL